MGFLLDALLDALLGALIRPLSPLSPAQRRTGFTQHLHDVGATTHDGSCCGTLLFACCCVPYKLHAHSRGRCITSSCKAAIEVIGAALSANTSLQQPSSHPISALR